MPQNYVRSEKEGVEYLGRNILLKKFKDFQICKCNIFHVFSSKTISFIQNLFYFIYLHVFLERMIFFIRKHKGHFLLK